MEQFEGKLIFTRARHNRVTLALSALASLLIVGCSLRPSADFQPDFAPFPMQQKESVCPADGVGYSTSYAVLIKDSAPSEFNMSVEIDGQLLFDDCLGGAQPNSATSLRVDAYHVAESGVMVGARFADETRQSLSLKVFDRGDCSSEPVLYFLASSVPLKFQAQYPDGPECEGYQYSYLELTK